MAGLCHAEAMVQDALAKALGHWMLQEQVAMAARDCPHFFRPFCPSFEITTSHETQIVDFLSSFTIDFVGPQGCQSRSGSSGTTSKEDP